MRKAVLIAVMLVLSNSYSAGAAVEMCMDTANPLKGGDVQPWPWGAEVRFPWARIDGVWAAANNACDSYFMFKVVKQEGSPDRFVKVVQFNPVNCQVLSEGTGWTSDSTRVITARMLSGGRSFSLTIRAFSTSVIRSEPRSELTKKLGTEPKDVIVISLYPHGRWEQQMSYKLTKMSTTTDLICEPQ